jgi:hypothetical protein
MRVLELHNKGTIKAKYIRRELEINEKPSKVNGRNKYLLLINGFRCIALLHKFSQLATFRTKFHLQCFLFNGPSTASLYVCGCAPQFMI